MYPATKSICWSFSTPDVLFVIRQNGSSEPQINVFCTVHAMREHHRTQSHGSTRSEIKRSPTVALFLEARRQKQLSTRQANPGADIVQLGTNFQIGAKSIVKSSETKVLLWMCLVAALAFIGGISWNSRTHGT